MPTKSWLFWLVPTLLWVAACGKAPQAPNLPPLAAEAQAYVRLVAALGERDVDSLDFYVGPPELAAELHRTTPSLTEMRARATQLAETLEMGSWPEAERERAAHLARNARALAARAAQLGGAQTRFDDEGQVFFGVTLPRGDAPGESQTATLDELQRLLPGGGALADRYGRLEAGFVVAPGKLQAVMARAVEVCRAQTLEHVPLPAGESVEIVFAGNRPWAAFSRYLGGFRSRIEINTDYPLSVDRVLQLACHEAYPGHHARNVLLDERFAKGLGRAEFTARAQFSPDTLISEGQATLGVDLAFPGAARAAVLRNVLMPLAGLSARGGAVDRYVQVQRLVDRLGMAEAHIARAYLDGRLEFVRADTALADQALMAHGEPALKYVNEFRTSVLTYTLGRQLAERFLDARSPPGDEERRWLAYAQLTAGDPAVVHRELVALANR